MAAYEDHQLTSFHENSKTTNIYQDIIDVKDQSNSRKNFWRITVAAVEILERDIEGS